MEMVYAALLLHSLGKKVDETGVKKVLEAAGAKVETAQIKALVSSLKDVNIEDAIKGASVVQAAATPAATEEKKEEKKEEKEEEKTEKKAEEAAAGLGALFG